jgi:hypothetical protein
MATLIVTGDSVTVQLTDMEKLETLHGDVIVARSTVVGARVVQDAMSEVHGLRAPGTGLPGVIIAGTYRGREGNTFAVCHGRGPGIVIELVDAPYAKIVLTLDDPEAAAARFD